MCRTAAACVTASSVSLIDQRAVNAAVTGQPAIETTLSQNTDAATEYKCSATAANESIKETTTAVHEM